VRLVNAPTILFFSIVKITFYIIEFNWRVMSDCGLTQREQENVPIDPDTCLALNKAYQEVLLDTLRSIEMALIENRDKQVE
jgi:hypothetical protein